MIHPKALIPPCPRVAIALVNDAFKEFPTNIINPIDSQPKRCERFGKVLCSIANHNHGDSTIFRYSEKLFPQFNKVERPIIFILPNAVIRGGEHG